MPKALDTRPGYGAASSATSVSDATRFRGTREPVAFSSRDERTERDVAEIVRLMPSFAATFADSRTLKEYSTSIPLAFPDPVHRLRQTKVAELIASTITRLFGPECRAKLPLIANHEGLACNIVDHQKLMSNPVQLSVPIVAHFSDILRMQKRTDIVGFSTSAVSLNEPFNRRSITFHDHRISLYPWRRRNEVMYWASKYDLNLASLALEKGVWGELSDDEKEFIQSIGNTIDALDFGGCRGLSDQLTVANRHLFNLLFAGELRKELPQLFQIDLEDLTSHYLIHLLRDDPESFPVRMLLEPDFREHILTIFDGLVGCWDAKTGAGSHFFWCEQNRRRVQLEIRDNSFHRVDSSEQLEISRLAIVEKLRTREWMPGQIVILSALVFYAGIKPVMGWSREFVTRMRKALVTLGGFIGLDEVRRIQSIPLDNMCLFSVLKTNPSDPFSNDVSAFDVIANGGLDSSYLETAGQLKLSHWLEPIIPATLDYAIEKYGEVESK